MDFEAASGRQFTALDFFAGSGLVTTGLQPNFRVVWANDISEKKEAVYVANHGGDHFELGGIEQVHGRELPYADLSWGSFPCQDLSLAGKMGGIRSARSGLVWHWLRVMDQMEARPPVVVAENVVGLVSAAGGKHYRSLHRALAKRGYKVGAVVLDAVHWLPQSRKRVFVIGVRDDLDTTGLTTLGPTWCHPLSVRRAAKSLQSWVWWNLPNPSTMDIVRPALEDIIDWEAKCDAEDKRRSVLRLIPRSHRKKLEEEIRSRRKVFPAYKRIRKQTQVLELRFDGIAGCLRTPRGGSSRQTLVLLNEFGFDTRLLTVREAARLMGAPEDYLLPGSYNDGYMAMGDAVAVPVVRFLAQQLLRPLVAANKLIRVEAS